MNEKINYHTLLPYTEIHEQDRIQDEKDSIKTKELNKKFQALSEEETDKFMKKLGQLIINCLKSREVAPIRNEYYHDIVNSNGRPDYRTIEVICSMNYRGMHNDEGFCIYNGYKVKPLSYGFYIYLGHLIELGSNLSLHLLSYFFSRENKKEYLILKSSYTKLKKIFNEIEENIKNALVSLQNLNLITFSEENNGNLVVNLNKDNILKLDEKHSNYSDLEEDFAINNYYGMALIEPECPHCFEKLDIDLIFKHYQKFKND
jgi:hypothetical protein